MGPPNQGALEDNWKGLQVGASESAFGQVAMDGGGHWGGASLLPPVFSLE